MPFDLPWEQWLRCCATNRKVAGSIPARVSGFFIDIKSFRSHYGPGVGSFSNRNEYQEHFLGGKGGRWVRLTTLPPSCAVVMKAGSLNFLEPCGPLQACNGTALPFTHLAEEPRHFVLRRVYAGPPGWSTRLNQWNLIQRLNDTVYTVPQKWTRQSISKWRQMKLCGKVLS